MSSRNTEDSLVSRLSTQYSVSSGAIRTILQALRSGGGSTAQFSHPEFGGMSQWSPDMTMVGDMFNNDLKSKLDSICTELATYAAQTQSSPFGRDRQAVETSYRAVNRGANWWPARLGRPSAVGAQNDLRYAIFPRRLVIDDGGHVEVYDTGNHLIFGVAQAQSGDQTLTFKSQNGLVRLSDLPKVE